MQPYRVEEPSFLLPMLKSVRKWVWETKILGKLQSGRKATWPCPCGYLGDPKHERRRAPAQIQRYRARISGPPLDGILKAARTIADLAARDCVAQPHPLAPIPSRSLDRSVF